MKKSILEIYALAICFLAVICFSIAIGVGIYDIVQVTSPEFTLDSYEHNRYQSNDSFCEGRKCSFDDEKKEPERPPEAELTKKRLEGYRQALNSERRNALQSLTWVVIILVIDAIVFSAHWRIARRAREANSHS